MHAVFIEVDVEDTVSVDEARDRLQANAPRIARENGARAAYWLAPQGGRGVSVAIFDTEDEAQKLANQFHVGESPRNAPPGITFRTVEVREVLASL